MSTVHDRGAVVIGSGPAGAMAALTLLQKGIPVTMLESGQAAPSGLHMRAMGVTVYRRWPQMQHLPRHISSGDPNTMWMHDFVLGGLSNYWRGAVPRFAPEDFSEGERLHSRYGWPVTYDDLKPYYERAERLLVVRADTRDVPHLPAGHVAYRWLLPRDWQQIAPYAEAMGYGLAPLPIADGPNWIVARSAAPFNSSDMISYRLQCFPRFKLLLGAHALRLEWCSQKRKVNRVIYLDRASGREECIQADAVVVAAGALASTKLLLDSACADFPEGLGNTEGVLGKYLHDHLTDACVIDIDRPLSRLVHLAYLSRAPYADSEPLLAAACSIGCMTAKDKMLAYTPMKTTRFLVASFGTMVPIEQNQVRLDNTTKDEFGLPTLDIHVRFDDAAQRNALTALERLQAVLVSAGYHGTVGERVPSMVPGASVHYGGTVRMHASPKYGMLNAWNRLHSVENVVVVDASSFTTGVEKNPTLTVMALAARAADHLATELAAS